MGFKQSKPIHYPPTRRKNRREIHALSSSEDDSDIPKAFCPSREEELRKRSTHSLELKKNKLPMLRTNSSPLEIVKKSFKENFHKRSKSMPYRVFPVDANEDEIDRLISWEGSVRVDTSPIFPIRKGSRKSVCEVAIVITPPTNPPHFHHLSPTSMSHNEPLRALLR
ncbi:hypothetical protein FDP41_003232 [Naegleria fowleri]|uniref:Uncharacterized protein n=1 Tax=Naegleria fowleri TaxID=5763 RepID=A0A6A5BW08_NAEFO|nr:uncharacterized protein FDP41_003232 [Naegleria fowleri]KAF0977910.1 hypothetical protein FDP41_003232 [Naegleria fowleri]CAG4717059.1 unnamed protein product [Naegleria fowleri]